ncbi:MAG: redox-sensing transcriptional repressor [Clostridiales bacterium]|jgi:redox-sensing transcriptional repressor|nr:redox-sensing transcriptional repressor [Clostridiales bacterium]MDN5282439.1 redox-sensing transcriptional repressor [Candidatus Ozemobacter sp.]
MEKQVVGVPEPTLRRLPLYYHYLKAVFEKGREHISCTHIGRDLDLDPVQIRKDLSFTGIRGLPKVGYQIEALLGAIEEFFGYNRVDEAFLVGVGNLGRALLGYEGFSRYGFKIVAAFDQNPDLVGSEIHQISVLPIEKFADLCRRMQIKIGVITVPEQQAQKVADIMVESGIKGIWNFAPVALKVPEEVVVENEIIASGLAVLTKKIQTSLRFNSKKQEVAK